jgi:tRNA1Val (adenine37-N6)-methyltransferase
MIQRAERLPELLAACDRRLGSLRVLPLQGRTGRAAERFLLHGVKGGRGAFGLLAPLTLHAGATHGAGGGYAPGIEAVLRDGAALPVDWA